MLLLANLLVFLSFLLFLTKFNVFRKVSSNVDQIHRFSQGFAAILSKCIHSLEVWLFFSTNLMVFLRFLTLYPNLQVFLRFPCLVVQIQCFSYSFFASLTKLLGFRVIMELFSHCFSKIRTDMFSDICIFPYRIPQRSPLENCWVTSLGISLTTPSRTYSQISLREIRDL